MKKVQLLFSKAMARANADGLKTQTRRTRGLGKLNTRPDDFIFQTSDFNGGKGVFYLWDSVNRCHVEVKCPYGAPGLQMWQREAIQHDGIWKYAADGLALQGTPTPEELKKLDKFIDRGQTVPAVHMPNWCCRFKPQIGDIRLERVQEITEAGAMAEGFRATGAESAVRNFRKLWDEINGPDTWEKNYWVWVVDYGVEW